MFTGFRFRREFNVLPWLKFNISKTGVSATIGPEAVHVTVGSHGTYVYADMPGKGTYFRRKLDPMLEDMGAKNGDTADSSDKDRKDEEEKSGEILIDHNLLDRVVSAPSENAFVDTINALIEDDMARAYDKAKEAAVRADGAFLAGFLASKHQDWQFAVEYFERALEEREHLGTLFAKFEINMRVFLPVAEDFLVEIQPNRRDCLLAIAVAHERMKHNELAIEYLQEIRETYDPDDLIIRLLLAELLDETYADHPRVQHEIITLAEGIENDSPLHAALMYYRGRALRRLDVMEGARDTFTKALRKKKDYPADLLVALRYERALLYEEEGKEARARDEFEKIYAVAPELEDVAERLGLAPKIDQPLPAGPLHDQTPGENDTEADMPVGYELEAPQK